MPSIGLTGAAQQCHTESKCTGRRGVTTLAQWLRLPLLATLLLLCEWALANSDTWQQGANVKPGHFAISIGIDNYTQSDQLPQLDYAVNDAERLSEVLTQQGYAVTLLTNFETNPQDLLARIVRVAEAMDRSVGRENGRLVLTYAGHGFQQDGENYLAMGNADPNNLSATSLSMSQLKNVLAETGIGKKILLIDACRTNPSRSTGSDDRVFVEEAGDEATGLAILFSSTPGEPSYEHRSIMQGVFSFFVAQALSGTQAVNNEGWVTVRSLFDWIKDQMLGFNHARGDTVQAPWYETQSNGDIRITQPRLPNTARNAPPVAEPAPITRPEVTRRRPFWQVATTVLGVLIVGAVIADSASDDDSGGAGEGAINLIVPRP